MIPQRQLRIDKTQKFGQKSGITVWLAAGALMFVHSLFTTMLFAQSLKRTEDILFEEKLVRVLPLEEKANRKIFGQGTLPKILLEAYIQRTIEGFTDINNDKILERVDFNRNLQLMGLDTTSVLDSIRQFVKLEMSERLVFDSRRSEHYFIIQSLAVKIPASRNMRGIEETLVSFDYLDCAKIFRTSPTAYAKKPLKNGKDINYADVFLLRLFNSTIVRFGEEELYLDQLSGNNVERYMKGKDKENSLTSLLYKLYNPQ